MLKQTKILVLPWVVKSVLTRPIDNIPYGVLIDRYLLEHPDEAEGVDLSRFSFQTPKPLRKNFVKKGTDHVASPDGSVNGTPKFSQGA